MRFNILSEFSLGYLFAVTLERSYKHRVNHDKASDKESLVD